MQQILALALESRCSVRHHAFSLRSSNLTAEIRLARLAELAFFAFWSAVDVSYEFEGGEGFY